MRILISALLFILPLSLSAQTATFRGKVNDGAQGAPLIGATILLLQDGTPKAGANSDLEGSFTIKTAPGTYDVVTRYVSYVPDTLKGLVLVANEVSFQETQMFENLQVRKDLEVVITGKRNQASSVTLFNQKRNSVNTIDGVSVDLIRRTGDPDVAAAMKRVTGVTVEGGKYVYVRGLGDRYSKSTLNGAELPGLDPNRNTVQMDIFPSSLIDNVIVYKNFTPDLPGSFSGGLIDIKTKDFPTDFEVRLSASAGYNTVSSMLDNEFLTYQTGNKDWLGYDDGTRDLPSFINTIEGGEGIPAPNGTDRATSFLINDAAKAFDRDLFAIMGNSGLNQSYQFSIGNQFNFAKGKQSLGFIAGVSYKNSFNVYDDFREGRFKNTGTAQNPATSLNTELDIAGTRAEREALWGSVVKLSYKPHPNHKITANYMHNQSGSSYTRRQQGLYLNAGPDRFLRAQVLGYLERSVDIYQLSGDHVFGKLKVNWIASQASSSQDEPDLRFISDAFRINDEETIWEFDQSIVGSFPSRFYRDLNEDNNNYKLDIEYPISLSGREGKIKVGGALTEKERDFVESRYEIRVPKRLPYNGNQAEYFVDSNFGIVDSFSPPSPFPTRYDLGLYYQNASQQDNKYTGTQTVTAYYAMAELPIGNQLRFIGGARYEDTDVSTVSGSGIEGKLDLQDILPSGNFIYAVKENMNVRASYSRTLARPTFREFSPYASFDFAGDFQLIGNPNLKRTLIDNYDLRWEWFPGLAELISFSAFYKNFKNPIERVINPVAANTEFNFTNVTSGRAYGIEVEFKKDFSFINEALRKLTIGGNVSLIESKIDRDSLEYSAALAVDGNASPTRPMFGQSPYVVNGELAYVDNEELGLQLSLSYNLFGKRMVLVGGRDPDVFEMPRGLLNFSARKTIGKYLAVRIRANNLLNPEYKFAQTLGDNESIFRSYKRGQSFSASVSLNF